MRYLKIFEDFHTKPEDIFYKFSYVHKSCGKGMIWNPETKSCQSKLDFINDRISEGTFVTDKPMDKYLMKEIVTILYRCERIIKEAYVKSVHSRYQKEASRINEYIDFIAREVKYGQLDRAKPPIERWLKFITPIVSEINKKMWIESTDGRKWSTELGKFEVFLELLVDLESTEKIQIKLDELSSNIYFYGGSTRIREYSEKSIDKIVGILKMYPTINVLIQGWHNHPTLTLRHKDLDLNRAKAVVEMLESKGVDKERMKAEGKGESKVVPDDEMEENEFGDSYNKNMRVDIKIVM